MYVCKGSVQSIPFLSKKKKLTEALKLTAPLTIDTCTEEGAAFNAFVNVVHIIELHAKIRAKHILLVTINDVYDIYINYYYNFFFLSFFL